MVKKLFLVFSVLICLISTDDSHGFEKKGQDCSKCHTLSNNEARDLLKDILPDVKIFEIRWSPSKGFWEVFLESGGKKGLTYVDFSKKYLMMGSMISMEPHGQSPWYLQQIPSYAKASEGYPPSAKSAEAVILPP
jgi:hypothetical protein